MFNIPWVYSAILAFEGQISVFNYKNGPDYRDLLPIPPPPGDVPSCAEGGVLGVVPGIMGCFQATEAMKLILYGNNNNEVSKSKVDVLSGRVLIFDALKMKFSEIGIQRDPTRQPITSLIDYQGFCGGPQQQPQQSSAPNNVFVNQQEQQQQQQRAMDEAESDNNNAVEFHSIEPKECFEKMIHGGWTPYVLDVRMQTEHNIVALPFTDHVVPYRTVRINNDVPESGDILIYCKGGIRGKKACQSLIEQGVEPTRLYNLNGGILKWQKDIDTSMPRY